MKHYILFVLIAFVFCACANSKETITKAELIKTKLFVTLPEYCPTPDAFALAPDGTLILSCPNFADNSKPGVLVKIGYDGTVSKLCDIPEITPGKAGRPMGIDFAPDGSLYVCANPRILRLSFERDSLINIEVVAKGIDGPNGLKISNNALYVTTPSLPNFNTEKNTSGVYRFLLSDRNVQVKGDSTDTNLIFTIQTQNPHRQFGLDGLIFNNNGDLLVGDFGDGIIHKLKLAENGSVESSEIYAILPDSTGIDGMVMDENENLYIAGFSRNEIWKIDKNKQAKVIVRYSDNNGASGELDQPVDLIIKNGILIISNFDLMTDPGMVNRSHGKPYTLSYLEFKP